MVTLCDFCGSRTENSEKVFQAQVTSKRGTISVIEALEMFETGIAEVIVSRAHDANICNMCLLSLGFCYDFVQQALRVQDGLHEIGNETLITGTSNLSTAPDTTSLNTSTSPTFQSGQAIFCIPITETAAINGSLDLTEMLRCLPAQKNEHNEANTITDDTENSIKCNISAISDFQSQNAETAVLSHNENVLAGNSVTADLRLKNSTAIFDQPINYVFEYCPIIENQQPETAVANEDAMATATNEISSDQIVNDLFEIMEPTLQETTFPCDATSMGSSAKDPIPVHHHSKGKFRNIAPFVNIASSKSFITQIASIPPQPRRIYPCHECPEKFSSYPLLKTHEYDHKSSVTDIHICEYCFMVYADEGSLTNHVSNSHGDGQYRCCRCGKCYKGKGFLQNHNSREHENDRLLFYCSLCPTVQVGFDSRIAIEAHYRREHMPAESLSPVKENEVNEMDEINMNAEFLDEIFATNTEDNSFQLPEGWDLLNLQLDEILHDDSNADEDSQMAFDCPKCSMKFEIQTALLTHLSEQHSMQLLNCNRCEATFQSRTELVVHRTKCLTILADPNGNLQCQKCNKIFKSNVSLNHHMKGHFRHIINPYHCCPYCSKLFFTGRNLKQHLRTVHWRTKRYTCLLCDMKFRTKDHLRKHVVSIHEKERNHACSICLKKFTQSSHLKQHVLIHTTGKPHECVLCNKTYWKKIDLERHMLKKHDFEDIELPQTIDSKLEEEKPNQI